MRQRKSDSNRITETVRQRQRDRDKETETVRQNHAVKQSQGVNRLTDIVRQKQ